MRKIRLTFIVSITILISSFLSSSNCDTNKYKSTCLEKLSEGYTFLKAYSLEKKSSKDIEYSFVFSRGINYMLTCATNVENNDKVEIRLYDKNRKLLFSNYNKKKKLYYTVNYQCASTGVHYITFKHHDEKASCGLSVLAFKRK